ncbi:MAG: hypothetical protein KJ990_02925 [Proteobacteria bacterium]|nr:hypothetical protein [Pseudomonadota bacterium]MBU1648144.1 hypothetical protein [Pseudomonadota bacterium]
MNGLVSIAPWTDKKALSVFKYYRQMQKRTSGSLLSSSVEYVDSTQTTETPDRNCRQHPQQPLLTKDASNTPFLSQNYCNRIKDVAQVLFFKESAAEKRFHRR